MKITKKRDMKMTKFYQLVKDAEVVYDSYQAFIEIRKDDVVIDVYMFDDSDVLEIEECSFELSEKQKAVLVRKIDKAITEIKESEENENFNGVFTQRDYNHFESLIA